MSYARSMRVEFNHCDPAGIVFYPRYFEMVNSVCENFFREVVGYSYHAMMADGIGVPTVKLETEFRAPSRLGDLLDWVMVVEKVGGSSVTLRLEACCGPEQRLKVLLVMVWLSPEGRPARWPERIRAVLAAHEEETA